jgi:hypothetical protein
MVSTVDTTPPTARSRHPDLRPLLLPTRLRRRAVELSWLGAPLMAFDYPK